MSHLLPSGVYKLLRENSLKNPNPVLLRPDVAVTSSIEVQRHFLCGVCEERFNSRGERWILGNTYQTDGTFPLYYKVMTAPARCHTDEAAFYNTSGVAEVDVAQITFFALSVFWRAAATDWPTGNRKRLEFGAYEEGLRKYLLE